MENPEIVGFPPLGDLTQNDRARLQHFFLLVQSSGVIRKALGEYSKGFVIDDKMINNQIICVIQMTILVSVSSEILQELIHLVDSNMKMVTDQVRMITQYK